MSGSPSGSSRSGGLRAQPERCADEREARDAARSVEREGDGQERAHRVGDHVDGRELERVEDVAQERPSVVEQIDAAVVEGIGQPVTRPVDGEHAVVLRERREDRHHLECAAQPTVDVQQRRPGAELEELCLALRPADSADAAYRARSGRAARPVPSRVPDPALVPPVPPCPCRPIWSRHDVGSLALWTGPRMDLLMSPEAPGSCCWRSSSDAVVCDARSPKRSGPPSRAAVTRRHRAAVLPPVGGRPWRVQGGRDRRVRPARLRGLPRREATVSARGCCRRRRAAAGRGAARAQMALRLQCDDAGRRPLPSPRLDPGRGARPARGARRCTRLRATPVDGSSSASP